MKKNNKNNIQLYNKITGLYTPNLLNGKSYVGSSGYLFQRFSHYYSELKKIMETKLKTVRSAIYSAILKHGLSLFKLEIIEYCEPEQCIKIEQKFINLLKPEYNILKIAGSSMGIIRSEETRAKMSACVALRREFKNRRQLWLRCPLLVREFQNRRKLELRCLHAKHSDG